MFIVFVLFKEDVKVIMVILVVNVERNKINNMVFVIVWVNECCIGVNNVVFF